jgi:hypothetical protein
MLSHYRWGWRSDCVSPYIPSITQTVTATWFSGSDTSQSGVQTYTFGGIDGLNHGSGGINANGVRIRYQSTDFPTRAGTGAATSTSRLSTVTVTATPEAHGLYTGAKAGIGVGVALGIILFLAFGAFLVRLRNRRKLRETRKRSYDDDPLSTTKPELDATEAPNRISHIPPEPLELPAVSVIKEPPELDSTVDLTRRASSHGVAERNVLDTPETPGSAITSESGAAPIHTTMEDSISPRVNRASTLSPKLSLDTPPTQKLLPMTNQESASNPALADESESIEAIQQRIQRIRSERARLTKIDRLKKEEEDLEKKLAALRASSGSES